MTAERTEAPTQRRMEEARRKGQGVGRSHELSQVMTLVAGLLALSALLPSVGAKVAGIIVDEVKEVVNIETEQIEDTPSFGAETDTDFILGVGKVSQKVVMLLDVDKVLSIGDASLMNQALDQS